MTHVIQALLLLISSVYFPISVLPEWMQPLARISPATYIFGGGYGRRCWTGPALVPCLLIWVGWCSSA